MGKKSKKKDREKVIYYDDNSTIVDMSNVTRSGQKNPRSQQPRRPSTFGEKWKTYWSAVKMMLFPMFMVLLGLTILYLIVMLFI